MKIGSRSQIVILKKCMSESSLSTDNILPLIHTIRGQRVILASDLAKLYTVPTKRLNEAVKRNKTRFPSDFMFQLIAAEWDELLALRSQIATLKRGQHQKYLPFAFTEHGAIMAANVLNSAHAIDMSVYVVRAFVKLRQILATHQELAQQLAELERKVVGHDEVILALVAAIRQLTIPPPQTRSVKIGFAREKEV